MYEDKGSTLRYSRDMAQFSENFYQTPGILKIEHGNYNITKEDAKIQIHTQTKEDQQSANIVTVPFAKKGDGQNLENWGFVSESTNQTVIQNTGEQQYLVLEGDFAPQQKLVQIGNTIYTVQQYNDIYGSSASNTPTVVKETVENHQLNSLVQAKEHLEKTSSINEHKGNDQEVAALLYQTVLEPVNENRNYGYQVLLTNQTPTNVTALSHNKVENIYRPQIHETNSISVRHGSHSNNKRIKEVQYQENQSNYVYHNLVPSDECNVFNLESNFRANMPYAGSSDLSEYEVTAQKDGTDSDGITHIIKAKLFAPSLRGAKQRFWFLLRHWRKFNPIQCEIQQIAEVPNGLKLKLNDALPTSSIGLISLQQNNSSYQKILSTEIVFSKQSSKTVWPNISNPPSGSVSASTYTQNAQHVYPPYKKFKTGAHYTNTQVSGIQQVQSQNFVPSSSQNFSLRNLQQMDVRNNETSLQLQDSLQNQDALA